MLHRTTPAQLEAPVASAAGDKTSSQSGVDLWSYVALARRQWLLIAVIAVTVLALGTGYLLLSRPLYFATANVLLDTRRMQLFQQQALIQDASFDAPAVESQMEVIRSESITSSVVDDLKLADDPEFYANATTYFSAIAARALSFVNGWIPDRVMNSLSARFVGIYPTSAEDRTRAAVAHFRDNVRVQRVRTTYVIEIGFTSRDAAKAVKIANAVADAYILDQTQSKQYTTRRAIAWLQERMAELRDQAINADKAVQDFRTKNNLVEFGLVSPSQLSEATEQLVKAREQTVETKRRLDRIREIMNSSVPDASMTTWLQNDVISRLRQQYVETSRREAEYVVRLGPEHQAVQTARKELRQIERSAAEELRRVADVFKADYEAAQARERAAEERLNQGTAQNAGNRQEQGTLQVLESTARTYRALYDTFLQRLVEATTQQNFQSTEARVITAASNGRQIHPNNKQVLTLASIFGLMLGCGAAYARDRLQKVFRSPKEIERALGVECLGVLPAIEHRSGSAPSDQKAASSARDGDRLIDHNIGIARQVMLTPFSRFTETMRSIKVAADTHDSEVKVIGFVSAVPAEGKSTLAANFAQLAAHGGGRTLLIDADLRQPSLTRLLTGTARAGLLEVLDGSTPLADALWRDPLTEMEFLPAAIGTPIAHTSEILASRAMADMIAYARTHYDYVILDFPPLAPVVDAKAASHFVDAFILVVEWGETSEGVVAEALTTAEVIRSKLLGTVLNRANVSALRKLERYKGKSFHRYYASYEGKAAAG